MDVGVSLHCAHSNASDCSPMWLLSTVHTSISRFQHSMLLLCFLGTFYSIWFSLKGNIYSFMCLSGHLTIHSFFYWLSLILISRPSVWVCSCPKQNFLQQHVNLCLLLPFHSVLRPEKWMETTYFPTIPNKQWDGYGNNSIITISILLIQINLLDSTLCA